MDTHTEKHTHIQTKKINTMSRNATSYTYTEVYMVCYILMKKYKWTEEKK